MVTTPWLYLRALSGEEEMEDIPIQIFVVAVLWSGNTQLMFSVLKAPLAGNKCCLQL